MGSVFRRRRHLLFIAEDKIRRIFKGYHLSFSIQIVAVFALEIILFLMIRVDRAALPNCIS